MQRTQLHLTPDGIDSSLDGRSTSYWTGPMVSREHPRYAEMQRALVKSFNFHNLVLETVEFLADGVGADEAAWGLVYEDGLPGEQPSPEAQALLSEAEGVLTAWWDRRDLPSTLQRLLKTGIAHGRAPLRPRIPAHYYDEAGRLKVQTDPVRSLMPLHLVLPDVGLSGIYTDPETLERIGVTQVYYQTPTAWKTEWEVTHVDDNGLTYLATLGSGGEGLKISDPLDLKGRAWLFELKFDRAGVALDVLSNQDALNVSLTMLNRNTHFAGFAQLYGIGIDPPTTGTSTSISNPDGTVTTVTSDKVVETGPGSQAFFQPSVSTEVTEGTAPNGMPTRTVTERAYVGASYGKLEPSAPAAIMAAIEAARGNIYAAMRQRFVQMDDQATASGRSREVATGSFLRATARYATSMEHLIREVLEFALAVSAIIQGQPGKYSALRATVTLRQQVFTPSSEAINTDLSLKEAGIISRQTLQTRVGVTDTEAEDARILAEAQPVTPVERPKAAVADAEDTETATSN